MELILGIDFGTSNTIISYFKNNKPEIFIDNNIYKSIKSQIGIKDNIYTCGNYLAVDNDKIIYNFKTNNNTYDTNNNTNILLIFFLHLKQIIYKQFPNFILKSVITVPSNFNDLQREIIRTNFINAGFNIIRIINEPSAAALAYGLSQIDKNDEHILVIDIGGGTLDISILLKDDNFFEIIYSLGINDMGGNAITQIIYEFIKNTFNITNNFLWDKCQNAKEKLSWVDKYDIKIDSFVYTLTIQKFNILCNSYITKLNNILINIHNKYKDIKYIIMVGNSSKSPFIKTLIYDIFKINPLLHSKLDSVVAEGACLYGAILENIYKSNKQLILIDILPLSLGIETIEGNFSIIIPKDTPLPIKMKKRYTTTKLSNNVNIKIYQGERKIAKHNILIGEFVFDKISLEGIPQIDIIFKVDLNSILSVTVIDNKSNIEKNILFKNSLIYDQDKINEILQLSNINNIIDNDNMIKQNRIYLLKSKIDIIMNNIKLNNLMSNNNKNILLKQIIDIEEKIELSNNTELLSLLNELENTYFTFYQNEDINENINENINEYKIELQNKIINLLIKDEVKYNFLYSILDNLSLSNISLSYIKDKLLIIKDIEHTENIQLSYYDQYYNLCLFIKSQIDDKLIKLSDSKIIELIELIDNSLIFININKNNNINWEEELNLFNNKCYLISF